MYLNGIRATTALLIVLSASIGVHSSPAQPHASPAVLTAQLEKNEASIATSSTEASSAAIISKVEVNQSTPSAELTNLTREKKVQVLQAYLQKHNSPMADNAQDFVDAAEQYNLDWRLVPAIAGVESTFGKHVLKDSYNPFGWGGGYIRFTSWREAIYTVSEGISEKYVKDGLDTPYKMQKRYAPPSTTWGSKVDYFMTRIEDSALQDRE